MAVNFVGNIGTKKIHSVAFADGRCRLNTMKAENRVEFESLEAGLNYPSKDRRIFAPCAICITKYEKYIEKKDGGQLK